MAGGFDIQTAGTVFASGLGGLMVGGGVFWKWFTRDKVEQAGNKVEIDSLQSANSAATMWKELYAGQQKVAAEEKALRTIAEANYQQLFNERNEILQTVNSLKIEVERLSAEIKDLRKHPPTAAIVPPYND